jgi:phosphotransferase system, enzyme I, PtsP
VMFPMVSEPWEFDAAVAVFENQRKFLKGQKKLLPEAIRYGAMLEVPALAEQLDVLAPKLSFLSIGTNDLTQFLFAADRANPKLAERYDWLSPSIMRFLKRVLLNLAGHPVDITVCGEMGGRRLEALALLGIGIHRLSITPASVGPIKELVRKVDLPEITKAMSQWLSSPPPSLREALTAWAAERGIEAD